MAHKGSTMIKTITALILSLMITGCASTTYRPGPADIAQFTDSATTYYGIFHAGAVEANPFLSPWIGEPVGFAALVATKQGLVWSMKQPWFYQSGKEFEGCRSFTAIMFGAGSAATINNLGVILLGTSVSWWLAPVFAAGIYGHYVYLSESECAHLQRNK